jgi:myo-inositol-1(or 4)-monophosphatase
MSEPAELRTLAELVSATVGREVANRREGEFRWTTKSSTSDVVTEIDTWSEEAVVEMLSERRPDDGFLGEEGTSRPGSSGITWVIDPVDGTTNLLYNLQGYSVSIAARTEDEVLAGAVFDPVRDEHFSAALGQGALLDGVPISVSPIVDLSVALVGTGFSYLADQRRTQAESLMMLIPQVRDIRRAGGAAMMLCEVAAGRLDACYERGLSPWDSAAGALIAAEAGAITHDGDLVYAAAPGIAEPFIALLNAMGA